MRLFGPAIGPKIQEMKKLSQRPVMKDGFWRIENVSDPVYTPNSKADPERYPEQAVWNAGGEFILDCLFKSWQTWISAIFRLTRSFSH
jgi:hypothetical protein